MDLHLIEDQIDSLSLEELCEVYSSLADYTKAPVSIDEFLDSPEFMGPFFDGGLYPHWRGVLREIYPNPYFSPYWLCVFRGAIGLGKSSIACAGMAYDLYRLLCMVNPQKSYNLVSSTKIVFALINRTLTLSGDVIWDKLSQIFVQSPFFSKVLGCLDSTNKISRRRLKRDTLFPHRIDFIVGSRAGHALGQAVFCLAAETVIPLLDGRKVSIECLVNEVLAAEGRVQVSSIDRSNHALVPGMVRRGCYAGKKNTLRIWLDNGKYVDCSEEHKLLTIQNKYKKAKHLKVGDRLYPYNTEVSKGGYLVYVNNKTNLKEPLHKVMARWKFGELPYNSAVHHKNYNKTDNRPENLCVLDSQEHIRFHCKNSKKHWGYYRNNPIILSRRIKRLSNARKAFFERIKRDSPEKYDEIKKANIDKLRPYWNAEQAKHMLKFWSRPESEISAMKQMRIEKLRRFCRDNREFKKAVVLKNREKSLAWIASDENKQHIRAAAERFQNSDEYAASREKHKKSMQRYYNSDASVERREKQREVMRNAVSAYWSNPDNAEIIAARALVNGRKKIIKTGYDFYVKNGYIQQLSSHRWSKSHAKHFSSREEYEDAVRSYNHRIVKIEEIGTQDCYDIEVDRFHNFALDCGIISSNSAVISEANFEVVEDQMYDTFNNLLRRMESRFMTVGGGIPGHIWLDSSESDKFSVVNRIVDSWRNSKGVFVSREPIWNVKGHLTDASGTPIYSGKRFWVFCGSETRGPEIVEDGTKSLLDVYPDACIDVPVEHRDAFEADINAAIRDLGGRATVSSSKLIRLRERLALATVVSPLFPDVIQLDFDDDTDQVFNHCKSSRYFADPLHKNIPRHIHVDIGLTGDRLGIAASLVVGFRDVEIRDPVTFEKTKENLPLLSTEWAFGVEPRPGKQIPLFKLRMFIQWLQQVGYPIAGVTLDGFQSADFIQGMTKMGFKAELLSVDKTVGPYVTLRTLIYEGRATLPINAILKRELEELELSAKGDAVDHPRDGTKDTSDAVAGSIFKANEGSGQARLFHLAAPVASPTQQVASLFWET